MVLDADGQVDSPATDALRKGSSRRAVPLNPWGKAVIAVQGGEPIHIGPLRKNVVG